MNFHAPKETSKASRPLPLRLMGRKPSNLDLARDVPASLLYGPTTPRDPVSQSKQDFIDRFGLDEADPHKYSYKPGDPRRYARNDAHVPDWGKTEFLNQPKSRADSLMSGSILDYSRVSEALTQQAQVKVKRVTPTNMAKPSRRGSRDRVFTEGTWTVEPAVLGNGGLINAVRSVSSADEDYNKIWVGTLGFPTDAVSDAKKEDIQQRLENEYESLAVYISDTDFSGHYHQFCKTILWPVFHYQIPDHPKSKAYEDHSWTYYKAVNQAFADKVIASYKQGDTVWVHDYHLLLVPGMVRDKLENAQIGLFLHTAFPSSEVFRCLSTRIELLEGMLGANLVAFQTREYAQHFLQTCSRLLVTEINSKGVQLEGRFVNVTNTPIGIEPEALNKARHEDEVAEWISVLQERYKGKKLIVGREKLDHTSGVRQKLLCFELFLNKYPEWREKVVLLQVATSTTENNELLATVADITTRIDAQFASLAHQPVIFLMQDISHAQYIALLSVADCLMITCLREGMGLATHDYICCQDGALTDKRHGPIILSEFTGTAAVFGGAELSVNPWDYQQCARSLKQALEMGEDEKLRRYEKLRGLVMHYTGSHWQKTLQNTLDECHAEQLQRNQVTIPRLDMRDLSEKYEAAERRLFILDAEGTLFSFGADGDTFSRSQASVFRVLNDLLADRRNVIYVMSTRSADSLGFLFSHNAALGLIAENGCFVHEYGSRTSDWVQFIDPQVVKEWKDDTKMMLNYYRDRIHGSTIEERRCSLLLHYKHAEDPKSAQAQVGECINQINDSCDKHKIHALPIGTSVLIESQEHSKATAAERILAGLRKASKLDSSIPAIDFLMVAGDDREDEAAFRWANELQDSGKIKHVTTVSMGRRNTEARSTLTQGPTGNFVMLCY